MHKVVNGEFVYLQDVDATIIQNMRYATPENFTGRVVPGYNVAKIMLTPPAALALKGVQAELKNHGYGLVVYDGYRPQRAVNSWIEWSTDPADTLGEKLYYPTINKAKLFDLGYIGKKSSHSRGSTVDLSIIALGKTIQPLKLSQRQLENGETIPFLDDGTVDMGSSFDLFHAASHHDSGLLNAEITTRRNFLRNIMKVHGFKHYNEEWWHYTLENEPFPDTYFDFVVN